MSDIVIDLYAHIIYAGPQDLVVERLLAIPGEAGRKVIVGASKEVLSVDDYLSTRTISVDGHRIAMSHPAID